MPKRDLNANCSAAQGAGAKRTPCAAARGDKADWQVRMVSSAHVELAMADLPSASAAELRALRNLLGDDLIKLLGGDCNGAHRAVTVVHQHETRKKNRR